MIENGGICFTYNSFIDAKDLKVEFVNPKLCTMEYVTAPLLAKIAELSEQTKPTRKISKDILVRHKDIVEFLEQKMTTNDIVTRTNKSKSTVSRVKQMLN